MLRQPANEPYSVNVDSSNETKHVAQKIRMFSFSGCAKYLWQNKFHFNVLLHLSCTHFRSLWDAGWTVYICTSISVSSTWRKFTQCAPSPVYLSLRQSMVLFTITQVLFQEVQKDDKVPVAGQIVKDGERQQSEMDLSRVIKDCNVYKNKPSFKQTQRKQAPDSGPTCKRQVSVCLVRETDGSARI